MTQKRYLSLSFHRLRDGFATIETAATHIKKIIKAILYLISERILRLNLSSLSSSNMRRRCEEKKAFE